MQEKEYCSLWIQLAQSRPDPTMGPAGSQHCPLAAIKSFGTTWIPYAMVSGTGSPPTCNLIPALGSLSPAARLQDLALPASSLAWKIPWMEGPGGLQSMGSRRVRQDCNDLARTHAGILSNIRMLALSFPGNQLQECACFLWMLATVS